MYKVLGFLVLILLAGCSGESYDVSNAISILPEKSDALRVEPSLASEDVFYVKSDYFGGEFKKKKVAPLRGMESNFVIKNDEIFYVDDAYRLRVSGMDGALLYSVDLLENKGDVKKKNVSDIYLEVEGDYAAVVFSTGHVFAVNLDERRVLWRRDLGEPVFIYPKIFGRRVFVNAASGAVFGLELGSGEVLSRGLAYEDLTETSFSINKGLKPVVIPSANLLLGYYKTNVLLFDAGAGVKIFDVALNDNALDFAKMADTPAVYGFGFIAGTTRNLSNFSLVTGTKVWAHNVNVVSNILVVGNFVFFADGFSSRLMALSAKTGGVKWAVPVELEKNGSVRLIATSDDEILLIPDDGYGALYNINSGAKLKFEPERLRSDKMDYVEYKGRIYYTQGGNLVVVE